MPVRRPTVKLFGSATFYAPAPALASSLFVRGATSSWGIDWLRATCGAMRIGPGLAGRNNHCWGRFPGISLRSIPRYPMTGFQPVPDRSFVPYGPKTSTTRSPPVSTGASPFLSVCCGFGPTDTDLTSSRLPPKSSTSQKMSRPGFDAHRIFVSGQTHLNVEPTEGCYQSHGILDSTPLKSRGTCCRNRIPIQEVIQFCARAFLQPLRG